MRFSQDEKVAVIMKLALEFNAAILTICTAYYGNMDEKNAKRFRRVYTQLVKEYNKKVDKVWFDEVS